LPNDKILFIYGGNLGQPQGIEFLLDIILDSETNNKKAYFIIVGSGTEKKRVSKWFHLNNPKNALLLNEMPQNDYNQLLKRCHVGMVFLHPNFTIPNYPSRILSYMENYLPIIFATDENTDVGFEAVEFNYGYWSKSGDLIKIRESIGKLIINSEIRIQMGQNGYNRLFSDFNVNNSYSLIVNRILNN
jgi:glycosyltransferase involved in cell wall biosynthesis